MFLTQQVENFWTWNDLQRVTVSNKKLTLVKKQLLKETSVGEISYALDKMMWKLNGGFAEESEKREEKNTLIKIGIDKQFL